jgi:hypothetical protein
MQNFIDEFKVATLDGVREYGEGEPVELWVNRYGRVVVRARNECGNNFTEVDLADLLDWSRSGSFSEGEIANGGGATLRIAGPNK